MKVTKLQSSTLLAGALVLSLFPVVAQAQIPGIDPTCDAEAETPEMGRLLNAEPKPGVITIQKVPRHPGKVGPYAAPVMGLMGQGILLLGSLGLGATALRRRNR